MRSGTVQREADFAEFVRAQQDRLHRFGWFLTGDAKLAEDLVQDALVRCWPKWERITGADAGPYVRRTMVNLAVSARRRKRPLEVLHADMRANGAAEPDGSELSVKYRVR